MSDTITINALSKWFGPKVAVSEVTIGFGPGITGLLGPNSNAHGPNEFLHIQKGKKLTCCVAGVLEDHFNRS